MSVSTARRPALVLVALAAAQLLIGIDYNIVFVALPDIAGVGFSAQQLQWVISAYAVAFGGFLLLGGRLADLLGRRRMFLAGLTLYAIASVIGGLATHPGVLVGARALQGLGGALLAPATLSLVTTTFAEGADRNRALGVWGAAGSSGMVLGSLLGGVLTEVFGWASVFLVNVPVVGVIVVLGWRVLPADGPVPPGRTFDVPGAVTATLSALLLVFALVTGPEAGWGSPVVVGALVLAVALAAAFVRIEARSAAPLVPLSVLRHRNLGLGTAITFLFMATFGASAYFLTLALQQVRGWDALSTGLAFVLPCALVLLGTVVGGRLATAVGVRTTLVIGLAVGAVGMAGFGWALAAGTTFAQMSPGIAVFSLAQGMVFTAMFSAATAGTPAAFQGVASGVATSGQQVGGALGLAVLVAMANAAGAAGTDPLAVSAGLQRAVLVAAGLILLGLVPALALRRVGAEPAVASR